MSDVDEALYAIVDEDDVDPLMYATVASTSSSIRRRYFDTDHGGHFRSNLRHSLRLPFNEQPTALHAHTMRDTPSKPAVRQLRRCTGKRSSFDEFLDLLRRILRRCLCCLTCGCVPYAAAEMPTEVYEAELTHEERAAVENLLIFMESGDFRKGLTEQRLQDLCVLTYSDTEDLQRSAAQCFVELSQISEATVSEIELEPLVLLLKSKDPSVQRASSLALSNYAIYGPEGNVTAILNSNALKPLISLLDSSDVEVQCNTCGCITTLSTRDRCKEDMVLLGIVPSLLLLAQCPDLRVQRNATGALLNLSHLQPNRNELVEAGAIPILNNILASPDHDVQYYCAAVLSNLAFTEKHRTMIVGIGQYDCLRKLIDLIRSPNEKVKVQALFCLRNLTSDADNQKIIVNLGVLIDLKFIISKARGETLNAGLALLRNLTIHKQNEACIVDATFLSDLTRIVRYDLNTPCQEHAAGAIRNLAAGDQVQKLLRSNCVEALTEVILRPDIEEKILLQVTQALAILADEEEAQLKILKFGKGHTFERLMAMSLKADTVDLQYSCAGLMAQLLLSSQSGYLAERYTSPLINCIESYLNNDNAKFAHLACWMLVQLLDFDPFYEKFSDRQALIDHIQQLKISGEAEAVRNLASSVLEKSIRY